MKTTITVILSLVFLSSCATTEQNDRANAIINRVLTYGEAKGIITPDEAGLVRDVGTIVLVPPAQPVPAEPPTK